MTIISAATNVLADMMGDTAQETRESDFPSDTVQRPIPFYNGADDDFEVSQSFLEKNEWNNPSFPPVDDAISVIKSIDWANVRRRARRGLNNVGLVLAVTGEKLHDFGVWLAEV